MTQCFRESNYDKLSKKLFWARYEWIVLSFFDQCTPVAKEIILPEILKRNFCLLFVSSNVPFIIKIYQLVLINRGFKKNKKICLVFHWVVKAIYGDDKFKEPSQNKFHIVALIYI